MAKRNKPYRPKPQHCPPLVACKIYETEADLQNHTRLERLRTGNADSHDFNWLLDTQASLLLGAHKSGDVSTYKAALIAQQALKSIRERFERMGKFGVAGDEFNILCSMLEISEAFWPVQSGATMKWAHESLMAARSTGVAA